MRIKCALWRLQHITLMYLCSSDALFPECNQCLLLVAVCRGKYDKVLAGGALLGSAGLDDGLDRFLKAPSPN
jgi:hypothetical protein